MMVLRAWVAGVWLAAATVGASAAREPDNVMAVEPGGPGDTDQVPQLARHDFLQNL